MSVFRCSVCGATEICARLLVWAALDPETGDPDPTSSADPADIDDVTPMRCTICGHHGTAYEFIHADDDDDGGNVGTATY